MWGGGRRDSSDAAGQRTRRLAPSPRLLSPRHRFFATARSKREGTPVTRDGFEAWAVAFDAEMEVVRAKEEAE
jgi:hypothetical protein